MDELGSQKANLSELSIFKESNSTTRKKAVCAF
jgi:hypothetical protein